MADVEVDQKIAASPDTLYRLVSDVTKMGDWSPETTSCRWLGGASGPEVGARFRGANRDGWRRWVTTCTVVSADLGKEFTFDVDLGPLPVSRWSYQFTADGDGTRVTESWTDRRHNWMVRVSPTLMGVSDRVAHNREGMEKTLAKLREVAES